MLKRRFPIMLVAMLALLLIISAGPVFGATDQTDQVAPPSLPDEDSAGLAPVLGADSNTAIPGQYIVVLKKDTGRAAADSLSRAVELRGGKVLLTYSTALNGFAATLPEKALDTVRANGNVAYIEADQIVQIDVTWGLDRTDQRNLPLNNVYAPANGGDGTGVHAYIIDTGMRLSHNEFSGRVGNGYDVIDGGTADDCNGHGTHVAGTVGGTTYGMASDVTLHPVRVLDCNGSGSTSGVIAGVDWVTSNHISPAVANMSLGGGASTSLDNAINSSINSGVTYAVAAGNDNANACNYSPARVNNALTVGSTTSSDARSSFSNYGSCVDIFAPGSSITSAWYTSNSATNTISGTSMATPHVAGAAALYLEANPSATPAQVFSGLIANATSGVLSSVGSGSPNLLLYVGGDSTPPPPPPGGGDGCDLSESYAGSLSGAGDYDYQPNGTYFYSVSGTHNGCLEGASGTDFDLYLWKWSSFRWVTVASSLTASSSESITYNGTSGYYVWRVYSYSGSGTYDFGMDRP
ncbi:MAG: S8 family peptidase [Anaerolineales bacterium]|nr:S8 family peptidase [Anaerolineales bacterium]